MVDQSVNTEQYKGSGKIFSTASGFGAGGLLGMVGAIAVNRFSKKAVSNGMVGFVALAVGAIGAAIGWIKSGKAQTQFEALKTERDAAVQQVTGLQTQVDGLNQEVGVHRKRYTDDIKPKVETGGHVAAAQAESAAVLENATVAGRA